MAGGKTRTKWILGGLFVVGLIVLGFVFPPAGVAILYIKFGCGSAMLCGSCADQSEEHPKETTA